MDAKRSPAGERTMTRRGRPRNPEKDEAIRDAAWKILGEAGYEGLTFEGLAERAGCTRATLYRRFNNKAELVGSLLYHTSRAVEPVIRPGMHPRDALAAHLDAFIEYMNGERGRAILSITEAVNRYPDLQVIARKHKLGERESYFEVFRRLHPDCPPSHMEFTFESLIGIVMQLTCVEPRRISYDQREAVIDGILLLLERHQIATD